MRLFCTKCGERCSIELGISEHIDPTAPHQTIAVRCPAQCFGTWYVVLDAFMSLASTVQHVVDAATTGPLQHMVVVTP